MERELAIQEFVKGSLESLEGVEKSISDLESSFGDSLNKIFRKVHSIKGTGGCLGFSKLQNLTHKGENLLSLLRDKKNFIPPHVIGVLLNLVDGTRQILNHIEAQEGEGEGEEDFAALMETLGNLKTKEESQDKKKSEGQDKEKGAGKEQEHLSLPVKPSNNGLSAETLPAKGGLARSYIRIDVNLLDQLMNLVGELVLIRNQFVQFQSAHTESIYLSALQQLNLITSEFQEGVMRTRMQPLSSIWNQFPRIVRELARGSGKEVRLEMEGEETELDKTLIEAIKDPLTHLVRNAVDHGIELPEGRTLQNKAPEGRLFLGAFHESGQVYIEISDDGGGIDPEKILKKAVEKGLVSLEEGARKSRREILDFLFLPGFSTASQVTKVSGRGVGLDIVKTNIERIGGMVEVQTTPGKGSTFRLSIPLTLAIIPALLVTSGKERYAIPQISLVEVVRLEGQGLRSIERIQKVPVYRLRGRLLPLIHLKQVLDQQRDFFSAISEHQTVSIVVLQTGNRQFGLVVDLIQDAQEIVVKPLGKYTKGIFAFAGATIMEDGRVSLILDVIRIAQRAHLSSEGKHLGLVEDKTTLPKEREQKHNLLIFKTNDTSQMAIPLILATRLETFPISQVEKSGDFSVVQYREQILPLVPLWEIMNLKAPSSEGKRDFLSVIIYSARGRLVGLVVDQILDVVEEAASVQPCANRKGILGTTVIRNRVTDLLDIAALVEELELPYLEKKDEE